MKAVIYARVSTDDQVEGASLDNQVKVCQEYCADKGYTVLAEFRDDISGASAIRPALGKAISMADAFDVLVVYSVDRFARDMGVHFALEQELLAKDTRIEFVIGGFSDTPEGQLYKNMTISFAQFERAKILIRTQIGIRARARSGLVTASNTPAYGYDYVDGYFEINNKEAQVVKQIFEWYTVYKYGTSKIAKMLSEQRTPTKWDNSGKEKKVKHKGAWWPSTVLSIVRNKIYYGEFQYGEFIIQVPAIIDKKTFLKAERQRLENRTRSPRNTKSEYLMRSRLTCAVCGTTMQGISHHKKYGSYYYYRCLGVDGDRSPDGVEPVCKGAVSAELVDKVVWDYMLNIIKNPEILLEDRRRNQQKNDLQEYEKEKARLEKDTEELLAQRARLIRLYTKEEFSEEMLDAEAKSINQQLATISKRIERIDMMAGTSPIKMSDSEALGYLIKRIDYLDYEQKLQVVQISDLAGVVTKKSTNDFEIHLTGFYDNPIDTILSYHL